MWYGGGVKEKALYNSNKYYVVDTLVDTNHPDLIYFFTAYNSIVTGMNCQYSLDVFSRHFNLYVGDDILVSRTKLIGGANEDYLRVISIAKSPNESKLKLLDLKMFPTYF
jgi:hypothetical protein